MDSARDIQVWGSRNTAIQAKVDQFRTFFSRYAAAYNWFDLRPEERSRCKVLASGPRNEVYSYAVDGQIFIVPSLPLGKVTDIENYIKTLVESTLAMHQRLRSDLPAWADEFRFPGELDVLSRKAKLLEEITEIDSRLESLREMKRALTTQSDPLVAAVEAIFARLPLKAVSKDDLVADLALIDSTGTERAFVEVKGLSRNVTREAVNQADSFRERHGKPQTFPTLLVVNTRMKGAASIEDKNEVIAPEQCAHACTQRILILRTVDLLNLLARHMDGELDEARVVHLLTESSGWLRVDGEGIRVVKA